MTMLRPVPGTSFPQIVLLLHRASLALHMGAEWEVSGAGRDSLQQFYRTVSGPTTVSSLPHASLSLLTLAQQVLVQLGVLSCTGSEPYVMVVCPVHTHLQNPCW
jgi:hypothetical protein